MAKGFGGRRSGKALGAAAIGVTATIVETGHTHANKALLDSYDQTNVDIADAVVKKHAHTQNLEPTSNVEFAKLILNNLPTTDPLNVGEVWNNLGILTISAG